MPNKNYLKFLLMMALSFIIMYCVMFLNVYSINHIYFSLSRFYMTLLMISPMALIMMVFMIKMYNNKKLNLLIITASILVFIFALYGLRNQLFISDSQYMKAMIPHHSSAILTSKNAKINNPVVQQLAEDIIQAQKREIQLMKNLINKNK